MKDYQCKICNYVYHSEEGDPIHGIEPKTTLEDLPPTWLCPVCGAKTKAFEPIEMDDKPIDQ